MGKLMREGIVKHPLNRTWRYGVEKKEWKYDAGIYRRQLRCHDSYIDYCLGERMVRKYAPQWHSFEVNEILYEKGEFTSLEESLEWLRGAQYKEYGCRLFCAENV